MIKDCIICLLGAALIQPFWTLATQPLEIVTTYAITFSGLFIIVENIDESIQSLRKHR